MGFFVNAFEDKIKRYLGVKYAVSVNSGTSAIHLALKSIGVKKGDVVFVPDMTFVATVNPVIYEGATPVFIDSNRIDGNMSIKALKQAFLKYKPKAVIVVSLYGIYADLHEIKKLCEQYNCVMIEDSTEALGSIGCGDYVGTIGDIGCFSFNGNKIITTSGGGMIVTNNQQYAENVLHLSTQARVNGIEYRHDAVGYNYRLSNLCAAVGLGQLEKINKKIKLKTSIQNLYTKHFANNGSCNVFTNCMNRVNNNWISCLHLKKPISKQLVEYLAKRNIEARLFWTPIHTQEIYSMYDFVSDNDTSKYLFEHCVCLPSDTNMTKKEQLYVCKCIDDFFKKECLC